MHRLFPAPFAKFLELKFPLHLADIFTRPVIIPFADGAPKTN
jgi:hypothetical protein